MTELKNDSFNPDFLVDLKEDKKLLKFAEKVFENPRLLAKANITELSPQNPALASKVLLSAYTRALKEEAKMIADAKKDDVLKELLTQYESVVAEFLEKNKMLASSQSQKGGV